MAGFTVAVLHELGRATLAQLPLAFKVGLAVVATCGGLAFDARAIRKSGYSVGLSRQTSKRLAHDDSLPWWITPLLWGLDTGTIWSTFRVSSISWVFLLSALLNFAPAWSGLVYGFWFAAPLIIAVGSREQDMDGRPASGPGLRRVQAFAILLLTASPVLLLGAQLAA